MDDSDSPNQRQKQEFNMAVSYLNRLNAEFYMAVDSSLKLDIHNWFHSLLCIYRELSTEMKEKEISIMDQRIMVLNNEIQEQLRTTSKTGHFMVNPELYMKLHSLELDLRKILKEAGLQNKEIEDAYKALK